MTAFVYALQCAGHRRLAFDAVDTGLSGLRASNPAKLMAWSAFQTAASGAFRGDLTGTSARTSTC